MNAARTPLSKTIRRFGQAREGVAAVEFSLIAIPFFFLTFGLAEVGLMGLAQTSLNFAVADAGRQIRTGQAQLGGVTFADVQEQICGGLNQFMSLDCAGVLYLDVQRFNTFDEINGIAGPVTAGEFDDSGFAFEPGGPNDIVVVRAYYRWRTITPMFETLLGNTSDGERILASSMLFRNEPY
jgi:Flp pilus assembly protein TadG